MRYLDQTQRRGAFEAMRTGMRTAAGVARRVIDVALSATFPRLDETDRGRMPRIARPADRLSSTLLRRDVTPTGVSPARGYAPELNAAKCGASLGSTPPRSRDTLRSNMRATPRSPAGSRIPSANRDVRRCTC